MFDGLHFQNLSHLKLDFTLITKLEKKLFNGFSNLNSLVIDVSEKLKIIDHDAFSDLKQLRELHLSHIFCIESVKKQQFSEINNIETRCNQENLIIKRTWCNQVRRSFFSQVFEFGNQFYRKCHSEKFIGIATIEIIYQTSI